MANRYASPTGRRYHATEHCESLNSAHMANGYTWAVPRVSPADIARRSFQPCAICKPSPMLRVVS